MEFALILPLLASLLLGITTGGFALAVKNSMTNAVREGARLGATLPEGSGWNDWAVDVRDRVTDLAGGDLASDEVCVEMEEVGGSTLGSWPASGCDLGAGEPPTPSSAADGTCIVKVWARRTAEMNVVFFSRTLTLDADALGIYERAECP